MQFEFSRVQHHARLGAPPKNGLAFAEPWKNALRISRLQRCNAQIASASQQPRRGISWAPSLCDRRKRLAHIEPRQWRWAKVGIHAAYFAVFLEAPPGAAEYSG
jgi:hypothetical protein